MTVTFAIIALVTAIARLGMFVALHWVPSDYSPIRHAVSDYAVGPTRRLSTVMTWTSVLTWLTLAAAVWTGLPDWGYRTTATALLVVLAVIFAVLPFAPTDIEGTRLTRIGIIHYVLAIAWFAITYSLTGNLSRYASAHWADAFSVPAVVLHWLALVSLIALVAALIIPWLRGYFGLAERCFLVTISLFYLLIPAALLAS